MKSLLTAILLICSVPLISSFSHLLQNEKQSKKNTLGIMKKKKNQVEQRQKKTVQQIDQQNNYFQAYHFSMKKGQGIQQFYIDTMTNGQIRGHAKVLWKHKNAYILALQLASEKIELKIYQNDIQIQSLNFYTKSGFLFNVKQDKLYRITVQQKSSAKIQKMISLNIQHYYQQFGDYLQKLSKFKETQAFGRSYLEKDRQIQSQESEQTSDDSQVIHSQYKYPDNVFATDNIFTKQVKDFTLLQLKHRLSYLLNSTKLLINQIQTKHLAQHTIQIFQQDSVQIYWQYELIQCFIVILCALVQICLINSLFKESKILV